MKFVLGNSYFNKISVCIIIYILFNFVRRTVAKRVENGAPVRFRMPVDVGSVEVFADRGEVVMTFLFSPTGLYSKVELLMKGHHKISALSISEMKLIWQLIIF